MVVAWRLRIVAAGIVGRVVDRIVPVAVVDGIAAVPAAVMRLQRGVIPAVARVLAGDDDALTGVAERPQRGRVDLGNAVFDGLRRADVLRRGFAGRQCLGEMRIGVDARDVAACGEFGKLGARQASPNEIADPVGAMFDAVRSQPGEHARLLRIRARTQGADERAAARTIVRIDRERRQCWRGLIRQHDQRFDTAARFGLRGECGIDRRREGARASQCQRSRQESACGAARGTETDSIHACRRLWTGVALMRNGAV
jgi:hypothetical protein